MEKKKCKLYEIEKNEIRKGLPVYLNIYSISGVNYFFQVFGLGIFHTGIEILEREYSFGSTDRDYSGVIAIRPGSLGFAIKEKLFLGNTLYNMDEIRYLAYLISYIFRGLTYDPFGKNCNHFTKFFAECLLKSSVNFPIYINRFTSFKTLFRCFYEPFKTLVGDIVQMKPEVGNNNAESKPMIAEAKVEEKDEKSQKSESEDNKNQTSHMEEVKKKPKRSTQRTRINRRIQRYKVKEEEKASLLEINIEKFNNPNEDTHLITSKTRIVSHNDFFRNFNQNILSKFEANLLNEPLPLKTSPRLFLENDNESNLFLKEVSSLNDLTINRTAYENFEEIVRSIQRKGQEKQYSLQKRKLFFLNSLIKYMKIALRLCTIERNYERAITYYKYCVEITEELLLSLTKVNYPQKKGSTKSLLKNDAVDMLDADEKKVINENSINIEFTEEDFSEYSSFYDCKEFLINTQIKLYHSIIFCNQRIFLFSEITHFCDKILAIDAKDWVARLKRGLYYYLLQDFAKAELDFKVAVENCPDKDVLKFELDKLS